MSENIQNVACEVCGGKGGFKKEREWFDCGYCEGFGFYKKDVAKEAEEIAYLLKYNTYRKILIEDFEGMGKVLKFNTADRGKTIDIDFLPFDRQEWFAFIKILLKFGHYNQKLKLKTCQNLTFNEKDGKCYYHWTLNFELTELEALDGVRNLIQSFEKTYRG